MSVEDIRALAVLESSVRLVDGHYQLAWRESVPKLPGNRVLAERRLQLLKKRFLRESELFEK